MKGCIAVIDTTFSRVNMGDIAENVLKRKLPSYKIKRITVPGIKDLPGAAKRAFSSGCDAAITLGWVGMREADKYSYLAMSVGLIMVEVLTGKIIIDVTVHEDEAPNDPEKLKDIAYDRVTKHAENLAIMLTDPSKLTKFAGMGLRQGYEHAGPIE
jgi:riboflavin synthase